MPRNTKPLIFLICLILFSLLPGCGGGSIGTGTEPRTTFAGTVSSERGAPIPGALIKLLNTGEETTSLRDGTFFLASTIQSGDADFEVTAGDVTGNFRVDDVQDNGAAINLELTIDLQNGTVVLNNLSFTAKINGNCDLYFENNRIIRQSGAIPEGTKCPLRVHASASSGPVSGFKFVMQRKRCFDGAPWHEIGTGITGTDGPGNATLNFAFSNDEQHCIYRVLVPVDAPGIQPMEFIVDTFQKEAFDAEQAAAAPTPTPTPTPTPGLGTPTGPQ